MCQKFNYSLHTLELGSTLLGLNDTLALSLYSFETLNEFVLE